VSFSATPLTTRAMYALIATPTVPSSLVMLSLTKTLFPLSTLPPHLPLTHLIFWRTPLTR
jgi:hypothetical protein